MGKNLFSMDPFMRFRLGTIIRMADPDVPHDNEIKEETPIKEEVNTDEQPEKIVEPMEDDQEGKPIIAARTRENDSLRQKKPELNREQMRFLIDHFNLDKKLVEANNGRHLLQAWKTIIERKQDQLRKTEKQMMIFDNLTINNYSE